MLSKESKNWGQHLPTLFGGNKKRGDKTLYPACLTPPSSASLKYSTTYLSYLWLATWVAFPCVRTNSFCWHCRQETTAGGISSVVYYLAKFPQYQEQARQEVLSILQDSEAPDHQALTEMVFLWACIQEAFRMNNPSNFTLPREVDKEKTLGGYVVPSGTMMCFSMSSVHHRESTWTDHNVYKPHRFLEPGSSLVSFGLGPRQCPAQHFAMWEVRTIIAMLVANYRWNLPLDSVHQDQIRNGFSFSTNLNIPRDLYMQFCRL